MEAGLSHNRIRISQYEVWHIDYPDERDRYKLHAKSAQQAKIIYFGLLQDGFPEAKWIDIRVKRLGRPGFCKRIKHIADYRGVPFVRAGMQCDVYGERRWVIDGDGSGAWFRVCNAEDNSTGFIHPSGDRVTFFDKDGIPISKDFEDYL